MKAETADLLFILSHCSLGGGENGLVYTATNWDLLTDFAQLYMHAKICVRWYLHTHHVLNFDFFYLKVKMVIQQRGIILCFMPGYDVILWKE